MFTIPLLAAVILWSDVGLDQFPGETIYCDIVDINTVNDTTTYVVLWEFFADGYFHAVAWFPASESYHVCLYHRTLRYRHYLVLWTSVQSTWTPYDREACDRQSTNGRFSRGCLR